MTPQNCGKLDAAKEHINFCIGYMQRARELRDGMDYEEVQILTSKLEEALVLIRSAADK